MTGILLSPFLVLSRSIAQKPVRRLRFPRQKEAQRRLLALGFYVGVVLVVLLLIGAWARWCLGGRDPWLWVLFWLLEGPTKWSRIVLLAYWTALVLTSVTAWQAQFTMYGRLRLPSSSAAAPPSQSPAPGTSSLAGGGNAPSEKRNEFYSTETISSNARYGYAHFGLNERRKSFHALALLMFAPGIVVDVGPVHFHDLKHADPLHFKQPAFMHLAFSVAFSIFIFTEYVRYFALWPFGASVHIFLSEFLDEKDKGSAILSHFYLLVGCASPLWLERWVIECEMPQAILTWDLLQSLQTSQSYWCHCPWSGRFTGKLRDSRLDVVPGGP